MLALEQSSWATLTLIVSLEAILLSTFVMIGQNRQAAFQQAKADHDYQDVDTLLVENMKLTPGRPPAHPGGACPPRRRHSTGRRWSLARDRPAAGDTGRPRPGCGPRRAPPTRSQNCPNAGCWRPGHLTVAGCDRACGRHLVAKCTRRGVHLATQWNTAASTAASALCDAASLGETRNGAPHAPPPGPSCRIAAQPGGRFQRATAEDSLDIELVPALLVAVIS